MEIVPLRELKKELSTYSQAELTQVVLRLAKHKKENKELLHYLCFEAQDEAGYITALKADIDEAFDEIDELLTEARGGGYRVWPQMYFSKAKTKIRKLLRQMNKQIRFSGIKATEATLRLYFCQRLLKIDLPISQYKALYNLYIGQVKAAQKAITGLHPDLQFDYTEELEELMAGINHR